MTLFRTGIATFTMATLIAIMGMVAPAMAETHEVLMLNKDPDDKKARMVFRPEVLHIAPGDTVKFISTDPGHNSVSDPDMIPEGAEPWKSKIGKDFEVTLEKTGIYEYYCMPHRMMGMVGAIVVGDDLSNLDALKARKMKGKEKDRFESILSDIENGKK